MKRAIFLVVIVAMFVVTDSCTSFQKTEIKTDIDTLSYFFGYSQTDGFKNYLAEQAGIDSTHMDAFFKGFKEGSKNYGPDDIAYIEGVRIAHMVNNQLIESANRDIFLGDPTKTINRKAVLSGFYHGIKNPGDKMKIIQAQTISEAKMDDIRQEAAKTKFDYNITTGEKFLAENKNKDGIKTTSSGLQYKIIKEGTGEIPGESAKVRINFRGTLVDGQEFDSSYHNNAPAFFRVNQVIKGWTEALKMMPVGSKWMLYIPHELGYGAKEQGLIPPFSALIYEIELLGIEEE